MWKITYVIKICSKFKFNILGNSQKYLNNLMGCYGENLI